MFKAFLLTCPPQCKARDTHAITFKPVEFFSHVKYRLKMANLLFFFISNSDDSGPCCVPVCVARTAGCVGLHDLATEHHTTDERLLLSRDGVCLRLLSLHLHSHFGKSDHRQSCSSFNTATWKLYAWWSGKNLYEDRIYRSQTFLNCISLPIAIPLKDALTYPLHVTTQTKPGQV